MNIIFLCHGNICRSPAAEYIAKQYVKEHGIEANIISRATSYEEIGNDIYPPMKRALLYAGVKFNKHSATRITKEDIDWADYIFYMDENNKRLFLYHFKDEENKLHSITEFTPNISYIEDPWYTDNFDKVVDEITKCVTNIFQIIYNR